MKKRCEHCQTRIILVIALSIAFLACTKATTVRPVATRASHESAARAPTPDPPMATESRHYPLPTCSHVPAPRFTAASWVAPPGLEPVVEHFLREHVFGTLIDPREGPLRQVQTWVHYDASDVDDTRISTRSIVARVLEVPDQNPVAVTSYGTYAVESVGAHIDVVSACRAALALTPETTLQFATPEQWIALEARVQIRSMCPPEAGAQLALLGEVELANTVLLSTILRTLTPTESAERGWYNAAGLLEHAIQTMLMGDDCLALANARSVPGLWAAFEAKPEAATVCAMGDCHLGERAERLIVGLERRVASPRVESLNPTSVDGGVNQELAERLAETIADVARARHDASYTAQVSTLKQALLNSGDLAIPSLIARLERPDGLMQGRNESTYGYWFDVVTVHDFVRTLLDEMLVMRRAHTPSSRPSMLEAAPDDAAAYRARFERVRSMSVTERCLYVLRASQDSWDWATAAHQLFIMMADAEADEPATSDSLRRGAPPGATRLIVRRARDALHRRQVGDACDLAFAAARWEPTATASWGTSFERLCRETTGCECADFLDAEER